MERRNRDGGYDLRGCVLPRGRIRLVATSDDYETSTDDYTLRQVAGAVLLLDTSGSSQYGSRSGTSVYDIRTDRSYGIASSCREILTGFCPEPPRDTTATHAFVNRLGQAAAAVTSSSGVAIAGFSARGVRTDLDSGSSSEIPPSSLRLSGRTVTWTHSGQPRAAQLSG